MSNSAAGVAGRQGPVRIQALAKQAGWTIVPPYVWAPPPVSPCLSWPAGSQAVVPLAIGAKTAFPEAAHNPTPLPPLGLFAFDFHADPQESDHLSGFPFFPSLLGFLTVRYYFFLSSELFLVLPGWFFQPCPSQVH